MYSVRTRVQCVLGVEVPFFPLLDTRVDLRFLYITAPSQGMLELRGFPSSTNNEYRDRDVQLNRKETRVSVQDDVAVCFRGHWSPLQFDNVSP